MDLRNKFLCLINMAVMSALLAMVSPAGAAPSGRFLVNINDSRTNFLSDSQQSITFWDAQNINSGPLFSVHVPGEFFSNPAGEISDSYNKEEPLALTVDPVSGDVYFLAFDSGSAATVGTIETPGTDFADTQGDYDLFRIKTQTVLNHWMANFEGQNARTNAGVGGSTPNVPLNPAVTATQLQDYVTYGVGPRDEFGQFDPLANGLGVGRQSNTFVLPGAIEKLGQVKRTDDGNAGQGFFPVLLDFVNTTTLFMVDDASEFVSTGPGDPAKDNDYRLIQRVSALPNQLTAPDTNGNFLDGGFNQLPSGNSDPSDALFPTQSWRSQRVGKVNLDFAALGTTAGDYNNDGKVTRLDYDEWKANYASTTSVSADGNNDFNINAADYTVWRNNLGHVGTTPSGHSEPISSAYYADPVSGVKGAWIAESDGRGDDVAFRVLDDPLNAANNNTYRPLQIGPGPGSPITFSMDDNPFLRPGASDGKIVKIFTDSDTGDLIIVETGFGDVDDPADPDMNGSPNDPNVAVIRRHILSYNSGGKIQFGAWDEKKFLVPTLEGDDEEFKERGQWAAYDSAHDLVYFFDPDGGDPNEVQDGVGADFNIFNLDVHVLDLNTGLTTSYLNVDDAVQLFTGDAHGDEVEFFSLSLAGRGAGLGSVPEPASAGLLAFGGLLASLLIRRPARWVR